ncbi:hypothetical protein HPB51_025605 [Rhipicephalus microplus]|uniref:THAP-type domain-containing protein n=1 Tax=Rhipicephalus microplus TaxID=6941 RepID=A0A9J6D849_RHIMP|nr:hypothetical protein HPB51_025605 [Rhipicephalus microplus]
MSSGVKRKASQTHCFAPGCSSGYVTARKSGRQVSLFSVPKDPERFKVWQRAVPRADKPLEATSVLCELHFDEQYLVRFFTHTINGETVRIPRDRPKLTDNAIPTVYPNVPAYLSKKPPQKRTSRTSTGAYLQRFRGVKEAPLCTTTLPTPMKTEAFPTLQPRLISRVVNYQVPIGRSTGSLGRTVLQHSQFVP